MANERDEEREDRPRIVDNRLLSGDERQGLGSGADSSSEETPRLEVIGGGAPTETTETTDAPTEIESDSALEVAEAEEIDEEALREQVEAAIAEQLEAASQQLGRPLTGKEREQVREQVEAQVQQQIAAAQAAASQPEMSPEEQEALRVQMEEEQFAAIQEQIGRELTDQEKDQVRAQMEEQAQAAISLEVAPVLLDLMVKLPNYAAVHLGLAPNPYTQLIARNDGNARLSLEALGALFDIVKPMLDNPSRREFERVIADLRSNYTRVTGQPIGPTGGPSLITGPRLIR